MLLQKRTSRKRSKNGGEGATGVYMRKGTTLRVMVADRPYGEFYDFYSVSPEYFGYTVVFHSSSVKLSKILFFLCMISRVFNIYKCCTLY
jgi:hypothetical protein